MTYLIEILEDLYKIPVDSIATIPYGYTNRNYLIQSGRRKYIARISPQYKVGHLPFESYVLNILHDKNLEFMVPRKILTSDKKDFVSIDVNGGALTLFDFISGDQAVKLWKHPFYVAGFAREFGLKVGRLHSTLSQIPVYTSGYTHENLIRSYLERFELYKSLALTSKHMTLWQNLLLDNMNDMIGELLRYASYRNMQYREIVHTDLRLENILIENEKISGIVDFDDILIGDQAYDLAKILVEIYSNRREVVRNIEDLLDIRGFKEFIQQYLETRKMRGSEIIPRVVNLLNLPALHILSIVGRDLDFAETERIKNIEWYSNFIRLLRNEDNAKLVKSELENL